MFGYARAITRPVRARLTWGILAKSIPVGFNMYTQVCKYIFMPKEFKNWSNWTRLLAFDWQTNHEYFYDLTGCFGREPFDLKGICARLTNCWFETARLEIKRKLKSVIIWKFWVSKTYYLSLGITLWPNDILISWECEFALRLFPLPYYFLYQNKATRLEINPKFRSLWAWPGVEIPP